ncbi:MAG: GNAT family N-acetyltransferase [Sphingobacteriales bacterium]|nr:MAG: GNAT family N-acetyltransferase [Sphingobacteriales bacterium]
MVNQWVLKPFEALNPFELYEAMALRQLVFVVEQNCVFIDNDGLDLKSYHLMGYDLAGKMIAYSRILPPGIDFEESSIGRVVTHPKNRGAGEGKELMVCSIQKLNQLFGNVPIRIKAQYYLIKFYRQFGFIPQGEIFLEDDIEHIEMIRTPVHQDIKEQ